MSSRRAARLDLVAAAATKAPRLRTSEDKEMTMRELLADFITSLDGYASGEGWPADEQASFGGLTGAAKVVFPASLDEPLTRATPSSCATTRSRRSER